MTAPLGWVTPTFHLDEDGRPVLDVPLDEILALRDENGAVVDCNCVPGVWGHCDTCDTDRWVFHHCPGGCDDITCENGTTCRACWTGVPCPVHDDDWYEGAEAND